MFVVEICELSFHTAQEVCKMVLLITFHVVNLSDKLFPSFFPWKFSGALSSCLNLNQASMCSTAVMLGLPLPLLWIPHSFVPVWVLCFWIPCHYLSWFVLEKLIFHSLLQKATWMITLLDTPTLITLGYEYLNTLKIVFTSFWRHAPFIVFQFSVFKSLVPFWFSVLWMGPAYLRIS